MMLLLFLLSNLEVMKSPGLWIIRPRCHLTLHPLADPDGSRYKEDDMALW